MRKVALITGITGQDGSYLAEFLIKKKYKVHGIVRRVALEDRSHRLWRIKDIIKKINIHAASLESYASIVKLIQQLKPTEIYHLGAQSYIDYAFKDEFSTLNTNINGFFPYTPSTNILFGLQEALRLMEEEGLDNIFNRHERHAKATREAVKSWGIELLPLNNDEHSNSLTSL